MNNEVEEKIYYPDAIYIDGWLKILLYDKYYLIKKNK